MDDRVGTLRVQIDATRVAGVNENVATLLLAAKFGKPVCPHAGGVGLGASAEILAQTRVDYAFRTAGSGRPRRPDPERFLNVHARGVADVRRVRAACGL